MQSVGSFAGSLTGVFIPAYLLHLGLNVQGVMAYFLLYSVGVFISAQLTGFASQRMSLKWLLALSVVPQVGAMGLLIWPQHGVWYIVALALLEAAASGLYYLPLHIFFASSSTKEGVGGQVGKFMALPKLVTLGAPLLAGIIAGHFGFVYVFELAAVIYLCSLLPLASIPSYSETFNFNFQKFRELFQKYPGYFVAEIFENIGEEMDMIIWPLAIFLTLRNVLSLGVADTILGAGSAVFVYVLGKRADNGSRYRILQIGAVVMSLLWFARYFTTSVWPIFAVSAVVGLGQWLIVVPFNAIFYDFGREANTREFFMFREYPVMISRVIVYAIGVAIAASGIQNLFWLGIVAYGFFLLAPRLRLSRA
jgi:MFS family permease